MDIEHMHVAHIYTHAPVIFNTDIPGINMSFMYHYSASGQTVKVPWHCSSSGNLKRLTHTRTHTHTYLCSISSSSIPLLTSHSEHESISDRLESIIMMKPGCNTSIGVAVVIQQSRREWSFCTSFYLSCTLTTVTFIWSHGTMDKRPKS